jgi:methyl-accepting chemotaxis protein
MAKDQDMESIDSIWKTVLKSHIVQDLAFLPVLGGVAYLLFARSGGLHPSEAALLMVGTGGLLMLARGWWIWQRRQASSDILLDRIHRILEGERDGCTVPVGATGSDRQMATVLDTVLGESRRDKDQLARFRGALARDWKDMDALLAGLEQSHLAEDKNHAEALRRIQVLGRDLKGALESTFDLDQVETMHRLKSDQHRLEGQAFSGSLDQVGAGLEHFQNLLEELHDVFPRLRREEEALGHLADAGLRHGAKLTLKIKGLVAQTPNLIEESHARAAALRRFRLTADSLRDQVEVLARRIEGFRDEAQGRIRAFGSAQRPMRELDSFAQQAGLLAVNAAILAQQGGGSGSLTAIGGRLRTLADQTTESTSGLERALEQHQQGLEHENSSLWTLQEVTVGLLDGIRDLLRMVEGMDRQAQELERGLDAQMGLVDQVRIAADRAELSLREIGERATGLESAHGRQWGVEAKLVPEIERLTRESQRLLELGEDLSRINLQKNETIWEILARNQELKRSSVYQQLVSGDLPTLIQASVGPDPIWNRLAWSRAQRRPRLSGMPVTLPLAGWQDDHGWVHLQILRLDALDQPEPAAVASWSSDVAGQVWALHLDPALCEEDHRSALFETIQGSALEALFPGFECRTTTAGVELNLHVPFLGFPSFLAGLGLEIALPGAGLQVDLKEPESQVSHLQCMLWAGPQAEAMGAGAAMDMVHGWIRDDPAHEGFLSTLYHPGHRPPCPLRETQGLEATLPVAIPVQCLGLGGDSATLASYHDRLLQAGATDGPGGVSLCTIGLGHVHPATLLIRLFQRDAGLAGHPHPALAPFQARLREEVLAATAGDSYLAAWTLLEDLQRQGWVLPLPVVGP